MVHSSGGRNGGTTEDSTTVEELDVREERQSCFAHRRVLRLCRGLRRPRPPGSRSCRSSTTRSRRIPVIRGRCLLDVNQLASDWPRGCCRLARGLLACVRPVKAGSEGREEEKTEDGRPAWQMMKAFFLCVRRRGGGCEAKCGTKPNVRRACFPSLSSCPE